MDVRVQAEPFDPGSLLNEFSATVSEAGAVVSFTGVVRNNDAGDLDHMQVEHYPGMTHSALSEIAAQASSRWALCGVLVIHRFGPLKPGESIMMVATASRHRVAAFQAAEFLMDFLKSRAPFWKKEVTSDDAATWVSSKDDDEQALNRW
jgi:molybdopterin synthase catalytic subunit